MTESRNNKIHPLAILGAFIFALVLLGFAYIIFNKSAEKANAPDQQAVYNITLIAAPTQTATVFVPTQLPTPTQPAPNILPDDTIGVGSFVKVVGTKGLGLNIRNSPGRVKRLTFLPWTLRCSKSLAVPKSLMISFGGSSKPLMMPIAPVGRLKTIWNASGKTFLKT